MDGAGDGHLLLEDPLLLDFLRKFRILDLGRGDVGQHCHQAQVVLVEGLPCEESVEVQQPDDLAPCLQGCDNGGGHAADDKALRRERWVTSPVPQQDGLPAVQGSLHQGVGEAYVRLGCAPLPGTDHHWLHSARSVLQQYNAVLGLEKVEQLFHKVLQELLRRDIADQAQGEVLENGHSPGPAIRAGRGGRQEPAAKHRRRHDDGAAG